MRTIGRELQRAINGIRNAYRSKLTHITTTGPVAMVQADALAGEQVQDAELFQHYGLTSAPPKDTMLIVVPIGGKTTHSIAIATEHGTYRLKGLKEGEVALYTDEGDHILLKRGNNIEVVCGTKVTVTCPNVQMTGNLQVDGTIHANQNISTDMNLQATLDVKDAGGTKSMVGMRNVYNTHTHVENSIPGSTNQPTQGM